MKYTKEEFKRLWDADEDGSGLTFEDVADCAVAWGLYDKPKIHPMKDVTAAVIKAADCRDGAEIMKET